MNKIAITEVDKDYILLSEIDSCQDISQRELSHQTGLSLGTVNLLLQKMIRDGLVKMETIPARRVVYMLTPQGLAEKAKKTVNYIRSHYRIIEETKALIHRQLETYHTQYDQILVSLPGNELDSMLRDVIDEYWVDYPDKKIQLIQDISKISPSKFAGYRTILLYLPADHRTGQPVPPADCPIPQASLLDVAI